MEIAAVLLVLAFFLIFFKLFALLFKASLFVLSIPLQIIGALFAAGLVLLLLPVAVIAGAFAALFAPFFVLGPFLPLLLVLLGIFLVVKK
ncbi:MAG: hypothetical protein ACE5HO_01540 [bacterium]